MATIAELKVKIGANVTDFDKKLSKVQNKMVSVGKKMQSVGKQMAMSITAPLALIGGAAIKMGSDFDKSLTQINTLVGISKDKIVGFEKDIKDVSIETARSTNELAKALFTVTSAGLRGADATEVLRSAAKASAVGLGDTKSVAQALTGVMQSYSKQGMTAAKATDILVATVRAGNLEAEQLAPVLGRVTGIAAQLGVGFEEIGASIATFTRLGVDSAEAVTGLRGILSTLLKPTTQTEEALNAVGLTSAGLKQSLGEQGLQKTLANLMVAFKGNDELLGQVIPNVRALGAVLGTSGAQGEAYAQVVKDITNSQGILNEAFEETAKSASFKMEQAFVTIKSAMTEFGKVAVVMLAPFFEVIAGLLAKFKELSPTTKKIIIVVAGLAAAIGPVMIALGFLATTILPALITGFGILMGPVGIAIGVIALLTAGVMALWNNFEGFRGTLRGVWAALKTLASNIVNKFLDIPTMIIDAFMGIPQAFIDIFSGIGDVFSAIFAGEFDKLPGLLLDVGANMLKTNPLLAVGIKMGEEFTEGMGDAFVEAFPDKIEEAADKVKDNGAEAGETIGEAVGGGIVKGMTKEVDHAARKALNKDLQERLGGMDLSGKFKKTSEAIKPLISDLEQARNTARALSAAYDEKPVEILQRQRDVLKSFIDTQIQGAGAITPAIQEMIKDYENLGTKIEEIDGKTKITLNQIAQVAQQVIGAVGQVFGQITDLIALQFQSREIAMDNFYAKQQEHLDNTQMSEKARANAQKKLDEDVAKSRKKFAKEKAKADKKSAIASAIMNTASAVTNALTAGPIFGPILAATIGALGAAQIATIKSTPLPSFATGGIVSAPMIAQVGDAPSGPEVIAPLDKLQSMLGLGGNVELSTVIRGEDIILVTDRTKANRGYIE